MYQILPIVSVAISTIMYQILPIVSIAISRIMYRYCQ
jgi:hypothetical protein